MHWLLHNYFLPMLNPSTTPRLETALQPLTPILTRYKKLLKVTTRDVSLQAHFGAAINSLFRDVERWVAEAKVAANVEGFGWGGGTVEKGDHDMKEKWALDKLCDALLEIGVLVPVSKK
jgi:ribosomal biogenesis protein LAS1